MATATKLTIHYPQHTNLITRTMITFCGQTLIMPSWTGYGWTAEPQHTLDLDRVTCADCRKNA